MSLLVLTADDVQRLSETFSTDDLVVLMTTAFSHLSRSGDQPGGASSPHRTSIPSKNHNVLFMPSRLNAIGTTMKVVSVPLTDAAKPYGLPASTIVMDEVKGTVKAILNARSSTALRNAAGSLLATRLIGPKEPKLLLTFGAGKQIDAHIDILLKAYPTIVECIIVNRTKNARLDALIVSLRQRHSPSRVNIMPYETESVPSEVIRKADIICAATSAHSPLFKWSDVKPGAHLNLIGSYTPDMQEADVETVRAAGKILVESKDACLHEAGDLIQAGIGGNDMVEIGTLVGFDERGSVLTDWQTCEAIKAAGSITIFKSVGVGVQDMVLASALVGRAERDKVGTWIEGYDNL